MIIANYHTHTRRCGHAGEYSDEEYVLAAIRSGIRVLGFSDHCPWPYSEAYTRKDIRMTMGMLEEYLDSIRGLKEKYRDRIRIYAGLECEYFSEFTETLKEFQQKTDFLLLGVHWARSEETGEMSSSEAVTPEQILYFADNTVAGMESGFFRYVNHPDHLFSSYPVFDSTCEKVSERIIEASLRLKLPLEYNLNGVVKREHGGFTGLGYPEEHFWRMAGEAGCRAFIGCDAHSPQMIENVERIENAQAFLEQTGVQLMTVLDGLE